MAGTSMCVPVMLYASTNKSQCVQIRDDSKERKKTEYLKKK